MLVYLTSRVVSCIVAFLYPGYASFKTLSQRPASEEDLERWLMYWSVLACVIGVEYLAEWLVSWCTKGASYLYQTQLEPTLRAHESQIDAALAQLRARVFTFLQTRARMLWEYIIASATGPHSSSSSSNAGTPVGAASGGSAQGPPLSDSVSGPTQMLGTLWRTYGPAIIASGTVLLQRQGLTTTTTTTETTHQEQVQGYDVGDGSHSGSGPNSPLPITSHIPTSSSSAASSSSISGGHQGLRERVASGTNILGPGGRFEEVEVPSDAEGDRSPGSSEPVTRTSGWLSWATGTTTTHTKTE
ncbi:hypothetical protein B0F90DRAFT_1760339 [Multifurca ochricompacta]|uniref:Protein YOP1 n=1 Tax=Multifurca ochricompacta TaxID=376703 RepID=A0AAD4LXV2_9AGAM|nr:hypothetical protein B0F90DRAFT_1760339 [Multifurca ochricompacta]